MPPRQDRQRQPPTHPSFPVWNLANTLIAQTKATATEEYILQKELYSRALFLEFVEQAQGVKRHYSSGFWFNKKTRQIRRDHRSAIKMFLDGMALFLCEPGAKGVTACALEVCVDETTAVLSRTEIVGARGTDAVASDSGSGRGRKRKGKKRKNKKGKGKMRLMTAVELNHPNQQEAYTVTLHISRNEDVPKETVGFAEKLLRWVRTADITKAARNDLFTMIVGTCRLDIQYKLCGHPGNAKIGLIKRGCDILAGCDYPPFKEGLRNFPVMGRMTDYYTPQNYSKAFEASAEALGIYVSCLERILESKDNTEDINDAMVWAYRFLKDRVVAYFLSVSLNETERNGITSNIEKLGYYYANILYFITIAVLGPQHHLGWVFHSTTKVCVTAARKSHIVATELNDLASATLKDGEVVRRLSIPTTIKEQYQKHESANTTEHCEMQLARFYIENPTIFPVVPYFGVSKLSCYCCDQFLKNLQHPEGIGYPGPPIEFSVRGTHGKIYRLWRSPMDMQIDNYVLERVTGATKDLVIDLDTLCKRKLQSYVKARNALADGPDWSSSDDENDKDKDRPKYLGEEKVLCACAIPSVR